ncbi:MAG: hypothetical protein OXG08_04680 [Gammaproteobacteria bacterium]|nr:hypothetical protein [Gammaproteobacteria bacterium]
MNKLMQRVQCACAMGALFASLSILAGIEGTYVLETSESESNVGNPTLTISVNDEGTYSATLTSSSGSYSYTDDIVVDENKFKTTFPYWNLRGEQEITYSGQVENGKLRGTVSSDHGGVFEFVGSLKEDSDNGKYDMASVDKAIEECYVEITGKPMDNIGRITRELDTKLEACVNKRVSSPERIELQYTASKRGLVPQVREEDMEES